MSDKITLIRVDTNQSVEIDKRVLWGMLESIMADAREANTLAHKLVWETARELQKLVQIGS
jgi:hypothetical protein